LGWRYEISLPSTAPFPAKPYLINTYYTTGTIRYAIRRLKSLRAYHPDGFCFTNLTLFSINILEGLEFSASIYNLFDQDDAYPGFGEHYQDKLYQDDRSLRFKLTYRF